MPCSIRKAPHSNPVTTLSLPRPDSRPSPGEIAKIGTGEAGALDSEPASWFLCSIVLDVWSTVVHGCCLSRTIVRTGLILMVFKRLRLRLFDRSSKSTPKPRKQRPDPLLSRAAPQEDPRLRGAKGRSDPSARFSGGEGGGDGGA
jgi:hypothetical protein